MSLTHVILTGDLNLMGVTDPKVPFARVGDTLRAADLVFGNLECMLYQPPAGHNVEHEGFPADPQAGGLALAEAGVAAVGVANNVNYGEAGITASLARLDALGIAHTGAGANREAARAPAIVECNGVRFGFLQRSTIYWSINHEAGVNATGVAVICVNTAYQVPMHRTRPGIPALNRAGVPPVIRTWAEPKYLDWLREDIAALRKQVDVVVLSCHWGLKRDVLDYMSEIAHVAIDAGADVVMGHGPHHFLPVELYRGKPVFYGMGSFSFHTGHRGRKDGNWIGLMAKLDFADARLSRAGFSFVRHNDRNETVMSAMADEADAVTEISKPSASMGALLTPDADTLWIDLANNAAR